MKILIDIPFETYVDACKFSLNTSNTTIYKAIKDGEGADGYFQALEMYQLVLTRLVEAVERLLKMMQYQEVDIDKADEVLGYAFKIAKQYARDDI